MQNAGGDFRHAGIARRLAQLRLKLAATFLLQHLLRDVPGDAENPQRLAELVAEDACVRFQMNDCAAGRDDAKTESAHVPAFRHGLADRVAADGTVVRMHQCRDGVGIVRVSMPATRSDSISFSVHSVVCVRDVHLPGRDAGGASRERQQVLAVLQGRVDLRESHRVLAACETQVRVVDGGDQRDGEHAERADADRDREPAVVERCPPRQYEPVRNWPRPSPCNACR